MRTGYASEEALSQRFEELVRRARSAVDRALLPADTPPRVIHEAMRYSTLAGGKLLRPVLVMAAAECAGGPEAVNDGVECAAAAVELVHTYSLVHDDLPAMDDDDMRRGQPANHVVYGEAIAILAGDALLTRAFEVLATLPERGVEPERAVRVIRELAEAAGTLGLIGGQVDDLAATEGRVDLATLQSIHQRKTGALFRACVRIGGLLGGAGEDDLARLTDYASALGAAFQLVDDILDVVGDTAEMGKRAGSDQRRGKVTIPSLIGLEEARRMAEEETERAVASLSGFGPRADLLRWLVRRILARRR